MPNLSKIQILVQKEWKEVFKHKIVLFSTIFLPILLTIIPLVSLYVIGASMDGNTVGEISDSLPPAWRLLCPQDSTDSECFQVFMANQYALLFLLVPLIIPTSFAAYSIVGEKVTRSLEPLLATPIRTSELLLGKMFAALIPAVIATWAGFAIYLVGASLVSVPPVVKSLFSPIWLVGVGILAPLLSLLSVSLSVMVSSRVSDPRVAEQLTGVVVLPVIGFFVSSMLGVLVLKTSLMLGASVFLLVVDVALVWGAISLFQRETILTRWK
ncbi:MAG TPA: ABC transporter permease subunit [Anaerolineales bacterium]|nr:ABC transporter permease subunit [Anaerolineales bacterium]